MAMPIVVINEQGNKGRLVEFVATSKTTELSKVCLDSIFYFDMQSVASHFYSGFTHFNGQIFDPPFEFPILKTKRKTMFNAFLIYITSVSTRFCKFVFLHRQKNETIQIFSLLLLL